MSIVGVLKARFPDLSALPELASLSSLRPTALDKLLREVATANDERAARKAILKVTH